MSHYTRSKTKKSKKISRLLIPCAEWVVSWWSFYSGGHGWQRAAFLHHRRNVRKTGNNASSLSWASKKFYKGIEKLASSPIQFVSRNPPPFPKSASKMTATFVLLLLSACFSSPVSAYGRGAPNCRSSVPSHGRGPQASQPPYQVRYREKEEGGGEYEVEIITIYIAAKTWVCVHFPLPRSLWAWGERGNRSEASCCAGRQRTEVCSWCLTEIISYLIVMLQKNRCGWDHGGEHCWRPDPRLSQRRKVRHAISEVAKDQRHANMEGAGQFQGFFYYNMHKKSPLIILSNKQTNKQLFFQGDVSFVATVVKSFTTFWTGVASEPLKLWFFWCNKIFCTSCCAPMRICTQ